MINRREFVLGAGAAVAWPLAARAQQPMPVIGFVGFASRQGYARPLSAFVKGWVKPVTLKATTWR
jgi:putative tryptophan/tyrosine transport system substrate-binding protein